MCQFICVCCLVILLPIVLIILFHNYLMISLVSIIEQSKCPYCYGESFCTNVSDISLESSFFGKIIDWFNLKNVYYGDYNNIDVVMKKLAWTSDFKRFDSELCNILTGQNDCDLSTVHDHRAYQAIVLQILTQRKENAPFQVCTPDTGAELYNDILRLKNNAINTDEYMKNIWTTLSLNVEPIILQLLKAEDRWPFPKYYGSCGRAIVEENRGTTLFDHGELKWLDRAYLAAQLLYAAKNLTSDHPNYRFYLTDISSDNIAVDKNLQLTFVDLENLIVRKKQQLANADAHKSVHIQDNDGFAFSVQEVCDHEISDHNYYSICHLILSKDAPYPMTKYGLLYGDVPRFVLLNYPQLFDLIEDCVTPGNQSRFDIAQKLTDILKEILHKSNH